MRILFATGGSGGHVYPVVAIIKAVQDLAAQTGREVEMEIIGSSPFFDQAAQEITVQIRRTWDAKSRQYFSLWNFFDILKLPFVFLQSLYYVWLFMPDVVFAKGGYASYVPALVARLFFIPVCIHESDSVPGRANTRISKWAKKIFISFASSGQYFDQSRTQLVGNPIRTELLNGDRARGLAGFNLTDAKPVILISGGSQGAQKINNIIQESLVELVGKFQVIHQTGEGNFKEFQKAVEQTIKEGEKSYGKTIEGSYRIYPFLNAQELTMAYAASDVIVSRAGAANLFEIAALGKPGVVIPITISNGNHQMVNATEFAKFGGILLDEQNLSPVVFVKAVEDAYNNRTQIAEQIRGFAKPEAAQVIAQELLLS